MTPEPRPCVHVAVLGCPQFRHVKFAETLVRVANELDRGHLVAPARLYPSNAPEDSHAPPVVQYETPERHYALMVLRGGPVSSQRLFTHLRMVDAVILVLRSGDMPLGLRRFAMLAEAAEVGQLILLVEQENDVPAARSGGFQTALTGTRYATGETPVVAGRLSSEGGGALAEMLTLVERRVAAKPAQADRPFLLAVDEVFVIEGRGTAVTGVIERGMVRVADQLDLVGFGRQRTVTCRGIERGRAQAMVARGGEGVAILVEEMSRQDVEPGMILAACRSVLLASRFRAQLLLLAGAERELSEDVSVIVRTALVQARLTERGNGPSGQQTAAFVLTSAMPLEEGLRFVLVAHGQTVGVGQITERMVDSPRP